MAIFEFHFKTHHSWDMGSACGNTVNASTNPAPATTNCIYIIHNSTENTTYVGYADNAAHRWSARTEVFHTMGIPKIYAKTILCAYCKPTVNGSKLAATKLEGKFNAEHILVRAVVGGLLGVTTNTNSQLAGIPFPLNVGTLSTGDKIRVYLPSDPWGKLEGRKEVTL